MTLSSSGTPSSDARDISPLQPRVTVTRVAQNYGQTAPLPRLGLQPRPLQPHIAHGRTALGVPVGLPVGLPTHVRPSTVSQHLSPSAFATGPLSDTFETGSRSPSWAWPGRDAGGATTAAGQALLPAAAGSTAPTARPVIVPSPTLGVVPMPPHGARGPQGWPQFNTRLGELCYLSCYPGDKRRDRCAHWLRGQGPIDAMGHHDISEMFGGRRVPWLVSPTVTRGRYKKQRYALNRQGQWHVALEVFSIEAVVRMMRREVVGKGLWGVEELAERMAAGLEPLEPLKQRFITSISTQHFVHSLVFSEYFAQNEVADLINCDGKLYGITTLHMSAAPQALLALDAPLRKTLARRIFFSIAKILRDMHAKEAVHFNVNLADLLFITASSCTLGGFLSAHFIGEHGLASERVPTHEPPEMALAQGPYDCRVDVWGLGMMLMRLLCGNQPFLAAAETPFETGLPASAWQTYISWHSLRSQGVVRPETVTPAMLRQARAGVMPLSGQLDCGMAVACTVDHELASCVFEHMLAPRAEERWEKDRLVSAAALLHQALAPQHHTALDDRLKNKETGILAQARPDIMARMGRIHDSWVAEPLLDLPPAETLRRPSNG